MAPVMTPFLLECPPPRFACNKKLNYIPCTFRAHSVHISCTFRAHSVHIMCTKCARAHSVHMHVHIPRAYARMCTCICTKCARAHFVHINVHEIMCTICARNVHDMCTICARNVHDMCTKCARNVHFHNIHVRICTFVHMWSVLSDGAQKGPIIGFSSGSCHI